MGEKGRKAGCVYVRQRALKIRWKQLETVVLGR